MSTINSNYFLDYSSLFTGASSSTSYSSSILQLQQQMNSGVTGYGVNNSTTTASQAESIVGFKNAAQTLQNALSTLLNKKNDGSSVFANYKAVSSDTDALTASYSNDVGKYSSEALLAKRDPNYRPAAPEELSVKTVQIAQTQKNVGSTLDSKGMDFEAGKAYRFEISSGDKTETISIVTERGDNNESVMKKIASAINDKDIGVRASVNGSGIDGSALTLQSRETGSENAFEIRDISGGAVSTLGIGSADQEAQDAKFYVMQNGVSEYRESSSNNVQLTDRTSAVLKKETDSYVDIGFSNDSTQGINSVRDIVNGFNALFEAASGGTTIQSARLAAQLQGLADTYSSQLEGVGITRNENGYLVIDEDKMQAAAESGALESMFSSDDKAVNYGFSKRLENIAGGVADNPNQFVTGKQINETSNAQAFWDELNSGTSSSYTKLYFNLQRYENMGTLFNSMF